MSPILRFATRDRAYWAFAVVALAATVSLVLAGRAEDFDQYVGPVPPVLAIAIVAVAGGAALRFLEIRGWTRPSNRTLRRTIPEPVLVAVAFATLAITADVGIGFAEDMNAPWPRSLLFYPAIALIAEVVLHLVPLAGVLAVTGWRFTEDDWDRRVWIAVAAVALLETVFQVLEALADPEPRIAFFVGPHLLAIGVYELTALRRFGFASIVVFRLVYYLMWHISWGELRLSILF